MPPARTARSTRSWRRSTRRAARSRRSRSRRTEELAHDYLWRVHKAVPRKGEIGIFNRSHYEDVLVVRVHDLVPTEVWSARYDQINDFERILADNGTTIVKFFLSIDRDEQRERFQARYDDPTKRWKFSMGDLEERKRWDDYQAAFDEALSKTLDRPRALVRHPGQPQVVPQPGRGHDPGRHDRRPASQPIRRSPRTSPRTSSSPETRSAVREGTSWLSGAEGSAALARRLQGSCKGPFADRPGTMSPLLDRPSRVG